MDTILDPELQSQVKYSEDITGAHQGPEYIPGKDRSTEPQYQPYQFVKIRISAKGDVNIETKKPVAFQPYRVLPIGNLPNNGFLYLHRTPKEELFGMEVKLRVELENLQVVQ